MEFSNGIFILQVVLWCYCAIVPCLLLIVTGQTEIGNKSEAEIMCRDKGGLASFRHFTAGSTTVGAGYTLRDGESAWISGYATFSHFVTWHGCFTKPNRYIRHTRVEENSIGKCIEHCKLEDKMYTSNYRTIYIGIDTLLCFCISAEKRDTVLSPQHDSKCIKRCQYSVLYGYSDCETMYIGVFTIVDSRVLEWSVSEPSGKQCVYLEKNLNGTVLLSTASCYTTSGITITGRICTHSAHHSLSRQCKNTVYCLENVTSSWIEAMDNCMALDGRLASSLNKSFYIGSMTIGQTYWAGEFRTFEVAVTKPSMDHACLSVTKFGNKLYLEPDECSALKYSLCENTVIQTTIPTSSIGNNNVTPHDGAARVETRPGSKLPQYAYVLIGAAAGAVIAAIIGTGIAIRLRRTRSAVANPVASKAGITDDNTTSAPVTAGASGGPPPETSGYDECTVKRASEVEYVYIDQETNQALYVNSDDSKPVTDKNDIHSDGNNSKGGISGTNAEYEIPDQPPPADSQCITPVPGPHQHAGEYMEFHSSGDNNQSVYSGLASTAGENEHQYSALVL